MKRDRENDSLNRLEILGAVSARLVHSLSNHLSVIAGNLCVAGTVADQPEKTAAALQSALRSANEAGALLGRFADFRRSGRLEGGRITVGELAAFAQSWSRHHAGAEATVDGRLDSAALVPLSERWLEFVLETIRVETGRAPFRVALVPGNVRSLTGNPLAFELNPVGSVEIILTFQPANAIDWENARTNLIPPRAAAAWELIRESGGALASRRIDSEAHESRITLPLVSAGR